MSILPLPPNEVHLWFVFEEDVVEPHLLAQYRELLTEEERAQEKRFHFERHQRQYLITRVLVRTVLSRYSARKPENWRFSKNDYGRPSISSEDDPRGELSFNLSHTDGLILCGVAHRRPIGVDVENLKRREVSLDIADRFFSPAETACLRALPPARQYECFFRFWTLKESYIKAKGQGLSIPLDHFSFSSPVENPLSIAFDARLSDASENWRFWLMRPSAEHLAAVCAETTPGEIQRLVMRRIIPLSSDSPFECPLLAASV